MPKSKVKVQFERLPGSPFSERQTQVIGREILKLVQNRQEITFDDITASGRKQDTPLHRFYVWDNRTAAANWRRHQTQMMVSYTHIRIGGNRTIPLLRGARGKGKSRIWVRYDAAAKRSRDTTKQKIQAGCQSLDIWIHMYGDMPEFKVVARIGRQAMKLAGFKNR